MRSALARDGAMARGRSMKSHAVRSFGVREIIGARSQWGQGVKQGRDRDELD
jgi:hypothetical protein